MRWPSMLTGRRGCSAGRRTRQIIFNLLGNAIKFTEKGFVKLKVTTCNPQIIKLKNNRTEEYIDLVIEVEDSGIGISKEFQKVLFTPFTQQSGQRRFGGTGLGLSITNKLVDLMNGKISVKSELNKGTIFTIEIPDVPFLREHDKSETDIAINVKEIIFEKSRIVLADDIESNRNYLIDALKDTNIEVLEAGDGHEACSVVSEFVPDLVITDIRMPKMNGFELLQKIKKDKKLKHIPVIAYSASVMKDQREKIRNSDFAGLLIKPVKIHELFIELMNHLPYKSEKVEKEDSPVHDEISLLKIIDPEELINSMETTLHDIWATLIKRQPINEVEEFGVRLIELGKKHKSDLILNYGEDLLSAAQSFNIKSILSLIRQYPDIIERFKNATKQ